MRAAEEAKVCTCENLTIFANFEVSLCKDLLSVGSEILHVCLYQIGLPAYKNNDVMMQDARSTCGKTFARAKL